MTTSPRRLSGRQRWQIALITAGAAALFGAVRSLPTGTALGHRDFRVEGGNSIEFCDPANPQFLPVVAVASPVAIRVAPTVAPVGTPQEFVLTLRTARGKPIGPGDLALAHTRKLHLLVVDPSLQDYQHVHPEPGAVPGEWRFALQPRRSGLYRVFADFVPLATGRGLYAVAEFTVPGVDTPPPTAVSPTVERGELRFTLATSPADPRARLPLALTLECERVDGGPVALAPVMGAWAHLVAFDERRQGFAHLHPDQTDLARPPDPRQPRLGFKVLLPEPGLYVLWAQVNSDGRELFAPFTLRVR